MFESIRNAVGSLFSSDEPARAPTPAAAPPPPAPTAQPVAPPPGPQRAAATQTPRGEIPGQAPTQTPGQAPVATPVAPGQTPGAVATPATPQPGTPTEQRAPDPAAMRQAAADLFTAMDGWGTNEDAIHTALRGRSAAEIEAIRAAYADHYPGRTLDGDLEGELSGDELEAARAAMSADPVASAAATLVNAASGWGTDEDAIMRTLDGITDPAQRAAVATEFERRTGQPLNTMLNDELSGNELEVANALAVGDRAGANAARLDEAMNGTFLGIDFGTNEDGVYSAIESARTPEERAALVDAYQRRTGRTLDTDLHSEMEGAELDVATSLVAGDRAGAAAARVAVAADGWGTDENAIYAQLAGVPQEQRQALIAQYNQRYGAAAGGLNFDDMLADELDGMDAERARQLAANGRMDPVFALQYAMDGVGTDEAMIRDQLRGRSATEIAAFRVEYEQRTGRVLDDDLAGENSGRDGFEISQMMLGEPQTPQERLERANAAYDFERGSGSTWLGRNLTDAFSDSGHYLDIQNQRMNEIGARMTEGTATPEDLARLEVLGDYQRQDVTSYQAARDSVTNGAAMVGTAVVGTAVSILTAGAASPAVIAALSALAGGAAGIAIRAGMQGASLSQEDLAIEALTTIASAASAGLLQGGSAQAIFRSIAGVAEGATPTLAQTVLIQTMQGALGGASNGAVSGALNEQNYQGDALDWATGMLRSTGMGAINGGVSGAVVGGVKGGMGDTPAGMDPRVWGGIVGGIGGGAGGLAQTAVDPATYQGRWEDIAMRFGKNAAINSLQELASGVAEGGALQRPGAHPTAADGAPPTVHPDGAHPTTTTHPADGPHPTTHPADGPHPTVASDGPEVRAPISGDMQQMIDDMRAAGVDIPEPGPRGPVGSDAPEIRAPISGDMAQMVDDMRAAGVDIPEPTVRASSEPDLAPARTSGEPELRTPITGDMQQMVDDIRAAGGMEPGPSRPVGSDDPMQPAIVREPRGDMADMIDNLRAAGMDVPEPGQTNIGPNHPDRRAMPMEDLGAAITSIPGVSGRTVVADGTHPMPANAITQSQAQRLVDITDLLSQTPGGRLALEQMGGGNVANLTQDAGIGSFRQGGRVNIDPNSSVLSGASTIAHEAHHAATYDTDVTPQLTGGTREDYMRASLRNEAEAQAAALEFHRELGPLSPNGGSNEWGHGTYHAAYDAEVARLQAAHPELTPAEVATRAREAATSALEPAFASAVPSTSIMTDPVTGQQVLDPSKPANYSEHYGSYYDSYRGSTGTTTATAPPTTTTTAGGTGGGTSDRGVFGRMWDGFTGFFGGGNASPATTANDNQPAQAAPMSPEALAAARARRDEFLGSDAFTEGTRPRGAEGSPTEGVEVWGQPSSMTGNLTPGHVGATSLTDPSAHSSFGPASKDMVEMRQLAAESNDVAPQRLLLDTIGTGLPPLEGARMQSVTMRQGEHYPNAAADPFHTPEKLDFSHVFDQGFINPDDFARTMRARQDEDMVLADPRMFQADEATQRREALQYQLMTVPMDQPAMSPTGERQVGRHADFDPTTLGRVTDTVDPATGQPRTVAPAQNCATDLMHTMFGMGVIGAEDFQILGGDEHGVFMPENDVTPQALYELLRWREHEALLERQRAAASGQ